MWYIQDRCPDLHSSHAGTMIMKNIILPASYRTYHQKGRHATHDSVNRFTPPPHTLLFHLFSSLRRISSHPSWMLPDNELHNRAAHIITPASWLSCAAYTVGLLSCFLFCHLHFFHPAIMFIFRPLAAGGSHWPGGGRGVVGGKIPLRPSYDFHPPT